MVARFSAAVPAAWLAKLKLSVCQAPATEVVASVSTDFVPSAASSTFRRTGMPAVGDQTRAVTVVRVAVKGSVTMALLGQIDTVVPAHSSAVPDLTILATRLAALVGSTTTVASSAPPKPVSNGAVVSSKLTTRVSTTGMTVL